MTPQIVPLIWVVITYSNMWQTVAKYLLESCGEAHRFVGWIPSINLISSDSYNLSIAQVREWNYSKYMMLNMVVKSYFLGWENISTFIYSTNTQIHPDTCTPAFRVNPLLDKKICQLPPAIKPSNFLCCLVKLARHLFAPLIFCWATNKCIVFSRKMPFWVCLIPLDSVKPCIPAVYNGKQNRKCFWACCRWGKKINSMWEKASSDIDCLNYLPLCQIHFSISKQTHCKMNVERSTISAVCIYKLKVA